MVTPAAVDLQVAARHALVDEAAAVEQRPRGGVLRQASGLDPAQVECGEGVLDDRRERLGHQPLARELLADPVADLARLRRSAADIVEGDRAEQPRVHAPNQEERQRPPLVARPPSPVDAVAERLARQVVGRPGRLPRPQEGLAVPPELRPGDVVAHLRQTQTQPGGLDRGVDAAAEAQHVAIRPPAASPARPGRARRRPARASPAPAGRWPRAPRRRRAGARA